jgi:hypothetical protein
VTEFNVAEQALSQGSATVSTMGTYSARGIGFRSLQEAIDTTTLGASRASIYRHLDTSSR